MSSNDTSPLKPTREHIKYLKQMEDKDSQRQATQDADKIAGLDAKPIIFERQALLFADLALLEGR